MKHFLMITLALFSFSAHAQISIRLGAPQIQIAEPTADSQVAVTAVVRDIDGNVTIASYMGLLTHSFPAADGYWVIQPSNDTSTRWILCTRPKYKSISTTTYTVVTDDFQKTINLTNTAARTVTLPDINSVNTNEPVIIKDAANTAGTNYITVQSSDLIEGNSNYIINFNSDARGFYKSGSTWKIQ